MHSGELPLDDLDPLPPCDYSRIRAIALQTLVDWGAAEFQDLRLLAQHVRRFETIPPIPPEQLAVFWSAFKHQDGSAGWGLVFLVGTLEESWGVPGIYDGDGPVSLFDTPPQNSDVRKFLRGLWEFYPSEDYRPIPHGARPRTWKHAIGGNFDTLPR